MDDAALTEEVRHCVDDGRRIGLEQALYAIDRVQTGFFRAAMDAAGLPEFQAKRAKWEAAREAAEAVATLLAEASR